VCLGHRYQGFDVRYNYIAFNDGEYRNTISAFGIQLNFTTNIVFANRAQCILNASVLEKVVLLVAELLPTTFSVHIELSVWSVCACVCVCVQIVFSFRTKRPLT